MIDDNKITDVKINNLDLVKYKRKRINFVQGTNVAITVNDNPRQKTVDVTISSTGGSGGTGRSYFPSGW